MTAPAGMTRAAQYGATMDWHSGFDRHRVNQNARQGRQLLRQERRRLRRRLRGTVRAMQTGLLPRGTDRPVGRGGPRGAGPQGLSESTLRVTPDRKSITTVALVRP
jgi:hypothetical protein